MFPVRLSRAVKCKNFLSQTRKSSQFRPFSTPAFFPQRSTSTMPLMTQSYRGLSTSFAMIRAQRSLTQSLLKQPTQLSNIQAPVVPQRRNMGIGSYVSEKLEGKKNEMQQHKERESFRHLRDYLISTPKFRFKEQLAYYEAMQAKVGKTDRLIGGQDVKTQEEMMKKKIEVFKSMTPLEQLYESPAALNMVSKSRICVATGLDRKAVDADLRQFDEIKTMHTWMHRRLKNGKSLPEDSVEMQQLMSQDPPPPSYQQIKMMQKAKQAARSGGGGRR